MYRYTCDICGIEVDGETENGVVQAAQHHLQTDHNLQKEEGEDVTKPNIAYEEEELKERIEELEE